MCTDDTATDILSLTIKLRDESPEQFIMLELTHALRLLGWSGSPQRATRGCRHGTTGLKLSYTDPTHKDRHFCVFSDDTEFTDATRQQTRLIHLHECESYRWITIVGSPSSVEDFVTMMENRAAAMQQKNDAPFPALELAYATPTA